MVELLDECQDTEHRQVADRRLALVPSLIRRLVIKRPGRRAVEQMHGGHHRLPQ